MKIKNFAVVFAAIVIPMLAWLVAKRHSPKVVAVQNVIVDSIDVSPGFASADVTEQSKNDANAIVNEERQSAAAYNKKDVTAWMADVDPNSHLIYPNGKRLARADIINGVTSKLSRTVSEELVNEVDSIVINGHSAVEMGDAHDNVVIVMQPNSARHTVFSDVTYRNSWQWSNGMWLKTETKYLSLHTVEDGQIVTSLGPK